jgi:CHASE2 domain-containing sensor protein
MYSVLFPVPLERSAVVVVEVADAHGEGAILDRLIRRLESAGPRVIGLGFCVGDEDGAGSTENGTDVFNERFDNLVYSYRVCIGEKAVGEMPRPLRRYAIRYVTNPWGRITRYDAPFITRVECYDTAGIPVAGRCGFITGTVQPARGIVRAPLVAQGGGEAYYSFEAGMLALYGGADRIVFKMSGDTAVALEVGHRIIPLASNASIIARMYASGAIPVVSSGALLRHGIDAAAFADRIVILTRSPRAMSQQEARISAGLLHATVLENMRNGDQLERGLFARSVETALIVLFPALVLLCTPAGRFLLIGGSALIVGISVCLFAGFSEYINILYPFTSLLAARVTSGVLSRRRSSS